MNLVAYNFLTINKTSTSTPKVYWNGIQVAGIIKLRVFDSTRDDEAGEVRLRLLRGLNTPELLAEMKEAGVLIKEVV
ncbi:hypothetical protein E6Q11_06135 [Candidatus Dojkabacteria bacterium]|uniref:Uncharacterized protein n=1 Tax=Candidatus Dojkabacteria bacterium TaxID=2099670 RepID=A0A5C7J3R2_9BACT|nr:MAG: hypothetical protein E6Q11_06135 [Candidatus Dojkabacteria bacterium]